MFRRRERTAFRTFVEPLESRVLLSETLSSSEFHVSTSNELVGPNPVVAVGSDGTFMVTWTEHNNGTFDNVFLRLYNPANITIGKI